MQIKGGGKNLSARKWRGAKFQRKRFESGGKISVHRDLKVLPKQTLLP